MSESIIRLEGREEVSEGGMCVGECRVAGDHQNPDTQEKCIGEGDSIVRNVHVVHVVHVVLGMVVHVTHVVHVIHVVHVAHVVQVFLGVVVHVVEGVWGGGTWG